MVTIHIGMYSSYSVVYSDHGVHVQTVVTIISLLLDAEIFAGKPRPFFFNISLQLPLSLNEWNETLVN